MNHSADEVSARRREADYRLLYVPFVVLVGPLTTGMTWWMYWHVRDFWSRVQVGTFSLGWIFVLWGLWHLSSWTSDGPWWLLAFSWGLGSGLSGLWLWVVWGVEMTIKQWTVDDQVKAWNAEESRRMAAHSQRAQAAAGNLPNPSSGVLPLGALVEPYDDFPEWIGVHRMANRYIGITPKILRGHTLIEGETEAGKSETIKHLVNQIARLTDWDILVIDGKGDKAFVTDVVNIIYNVRGKPIPLFLLGHGELGSRFDAFQGSGNELCNQLIKLTGVHELEANATHYKEMYRVILRLVCEAPIGPPRSLEEVDARLDLDWCEAAWETDSDAKRAIKRLRPYAKDLTGFFTRMSSLVLTFRDYIGPGGFRLGDPGDAVFSLCNMTVGDDAPRFLEFFIEKLKGYTGQEITRPTILFIDEFGVFGNQNIKLLLQQGRNKGLGVVLSTQSIASLGTAIQQQEFLAYCTNKFQMCSGSSEVSEQAGTTTRIDVSTQHKEGELTGTTTARIRLAPKIDPNLVAGLPAGEGFFIRKSRTWHVRVPQVRDIVWRPEAIATYRYMPSRTSPKKQPPAPMP